MWKLFIIAIVGYFLYKFFSDREKTMKQTAREGGLKKKYSVLLSYLWDENAELEILTRESLVFRVKTKYYIHRFSILQSFGKVIISWKAKSPFSAFQEKWEFADTMDQRIMAERIMVVMQERMDDPASGDEIMKVIDGL